MALFNSMRARLMSGAILIAAVAYSTSASAQIVVADVGTPSVISAITTTGGTTTSAVNAQGSSIVSAINTHNTNRGNFESGATSQFYDDSRERLDKLINSLSHVDTDSRDNDLYASLDSQNTAREAILGLSDANGSNYGLSAMPATGGNIDTYLQRYAFLKPVELHPTNMAAQNHITDIQKALYYSESMVGEADAARQARYDVYQELATKAKSTDDAQAALEVNNALLVENGRNLALLIHLQTAQLNSDSAFLRDMMQERQMTSGLFGKVGTGP